MAKSEYTMTVQIDKASLRAALKSLKPLRMEIERVIRRARLALALIEKLNRARGGPSDGDV